VISKRTAIRSAAIGGAVLLALIAAAWASRDALARLVRARLVRGLQESFASDLQIGRLDVRVFPGLHLTGENIVLHYQGRRDLPPLISIRKLTADDNVAALLTGRIRQVRLEGLEIQAPPKSAGGKPFKKSRSGKIGGFVVDEIVADGTVLRTLPKDPGKAPLEWQIRRLRLDGAGPLSSMAFHAELENAKPPGIIRTTGRFGPWQADAPQDTPVQGNYTFDHADLSVFRGISGTLSSQGAYRGVLQRIDVQGHTDTPDFALKASGNPVDLKTRFQAVVDGTDGDTLLRQVDGWFGNSAVEARGSVAGTRGVKGKTVSLDVTADHGRLEDMLRLAVKGSPAMSGAVRFHARLTIPPQARDVAERMKMEAEFRAASARFSSFDVQQKINRLSHGGKGRPRESPSDFAASDFAGRFQLANGVIDFQSLSFQVPGVSVALSGNYGLLDESLDFNGTATMQARLSQATTGVKSLLLKAVDPFFDRKGSGAVIPLHIGGTRQKPSFGLDFRRK